MIQAIIIDDEIDAQITIASFVASFCPEVTICAKAQSVSEGIECIKTHQPDLVFLDINIIEGSGFDILSGVQQENFQVIFTTAYEKYALQAFRVKAIDYLLKPINPLELQEAVARASISISHKKRINELETLKKIGLQEKDKINFAKFTDIIRFEADHNYTKVFLSSQKNLLISKTLKTFEKLLEGQSFIRVHQSHLINIDYINYFDKKRACLHLRDGSQIPVSRRMKSQVTKLGHIQIV